MKSVEKILASILIVAAVVPDAAGAKRLTSESLKGSRIDRPVAAPEGRVGYDMKMVSGKRSAGDGSANVASAGGNRAGGRSSRRLNVRSFCGVKFGAKAPVGRKEVTIQANKPYFRFYSTLKLKYSPHGGLYSVTAVNDDPYTLRSIDDEMKRIMRELEKTYDFRFSGEIEHSDNGVKPAAAPGAGESSGNAEMDAALAKMASMFAGLLSEKDKPRPATRWESRISQEFANFRLSLLGVRDDDKNEKFVEITLERLMEL